MSEPVTMPTLQVSSDCAHWESKVLESDGGQLASAIADYLGVSHAAARIHLFQYLTNYVNPSLQPTPLKARIAFASGLVAGYLLSMGRKVKPLTRDGLPFAQLIILRGDSPVELKSAAEIADRHADLTSIQMEIIGMRDLLRGSPPPTTSMVGPGWSGLDCIAALPRLRRCVAGSWKLASWLNVPESTWRRFGIALAPILAQYVRESKIYFQRSAATQMWVTSYTSTCSLLADAAREAGKLESVTVMHGVPLLPFAARTTTDAIITEFESDRKVLARYGFCREVRAGRDLRKLIARAVAGRSDSDLVPTWHSVGYSTNLFLALGKFAGTDDQMMGSLRVPNGERCAQVLTEFAREWSIQKILVKIHPREDPASYEPTLLRWRVMGITGEFVERDPLFQESSCLHVAHMSTLGLDLLAQGKRVAFFRLSFPQDEENTLGAVASAVSFATAEELGAVAAMSEREYWALVENTLDALNF